MEDEEYSPYEINQKNCLQIDLFNDILKWTLWEKARVGCLERTASKHAYYQGWNRSPAQVGCMRQVLRAGALGRPRGMGWGGRQEGGLGWRTHVNPWLIHVNVWQKPLQYYKVISLQQIKINGKKKSKKNPISVFGETVHKLWLILPWEALSDAHWSALQAWEHVQTTENSPVYFIPS